LGSPPKQFTAFLIRLEIIVDLVQFPNQPAWG
jgi:hypothetical protein